ncbi:putative phage tail assembly chaperone [Photobacterium sp. OFAV2-7]|uniref:putative phage tail assembly chaperone n=1 Tax=Photobacterium sp. OFAV2-7 TaxID=2917748 RepID=UPI001EF56021|nr:putative phage tail assembly chaperone [Photobacterium sp. OFAV2-7]MCG7585674.1 putative phage tail assembly chaperone [Photobacterium sp. OFAV2-7]
MNEKKVITLTVGDKELKFEPTETAYNDCANSTAQGDVAAAYHNFVFETATEETKKVLREMLKGNPGTTMQVGAAVTQEYAPKLDIKVKK